MKRLAVTCLLLQTAATPRSALSFSLKDTPSSTSNKERTTSSLLGRRHFFQAATPFLIFGYNPTAAVAIPYVEKQLKLILESPDETAGLALRDVQIGSPPRTVVAIKEIMVPTKKNRDLQPGLILKGANNAKSVVNRIQKGPYPIELEFYNLDGSDGELGEALTAQDALDLSRRTSASAASTNNPPSSDINPPSNAYVKRIIKKPDSCRLQSRRDDVLEIIYEARISTPDGIIYDASEFRGTGRPYQMVLGSGDMLPGVDQGLYDMCEGEVRQLEIPPGLAYGPRGNKIYRIPPNVNLVWEVELVSISTQRDMPGADEDDEM